MPSTVQSVSKMGFVICSVCNEPIQLETSKTDENGKATQEECYIVRVIGKKLARPHCARSNTCR
jgi:hypothetical protein